MTTITLIGSGNMARGIATRVLAGGNDVQILDRDPARAARLAQDLGPGKATVDSGAIGDPISGDLVVLAVPYDAAAAVVEQNGPALTGKVIVDIANPVDFTTFDLVTTDRRSAAEEVAAVAPAGSVVLKAFNTTFAPTLVAGQVDGQPLDVLIAGDNQDAKSALAAVVQAGGLRAVDTGPLKRARELEALGLLHIALQTGRRPQYATAIKIVD